MAIFNYLDRIKRIDQLVKMQATGTPKDLAAKLKISKSTVFEYINVMKAMNAPIEYNSYTETYYYKEKGKFELGYKLQELTPDELKNTNAGFFKRNFNFFFSVR